MSGGVVGGRYCIALNAGATLRVFFFGAGNTCMGVEYIGSEFGEGFLMGGVQFLGDAGLWRCGLLFCCYLGGGWYN